MAFVVVNTAPVRRPLHLHDGLDTKPSPQVPVTGNLYAAIQVEKNMHDRVIVWNFDDLAIRKNHTERRRELVPVVIAMKVIDQQKSTAKQMLSQIRSFFVRWVPSSSPRLLQEQKR